MTDTKREIEKLIERKDEALRAAKDFIHDACDPELDTLSTERELVEQIEAALSPAPQPDAVQADDVIERAVDIAEQLVSAIGKPSTPRHIIEALAAANLLRQPAPVKASGDFVLVPRAQTSAMQRAGMDHLVSSDATEDWRASAVAEIWTAMLKAAPASAPADAAAMREKIAKIRGRHGRAENSQKGAGEWLADYAQSAHEDRGELLDILSQGALGSNLKYLVQYRRKDGGHDWVNMAAFDVESAAENYASQNAKDGGENCPWEYRALPTAQPDTRDATPNYRCFHCEEIFTERAKAEEHFGTKSIETVDAGADKPLCVAEQQELISARKQRDEYAASRAHLLERIVAREATIKALVEAVGELKKAYWNGVDFVSKEVGAACLKLFQEAAALTAASRSL